MIYKKYMGYAATALLSGIIGFSYANNKVLKASMDDKYLLENIVNLVEDRKEPQALREALIVRLANQDVITMYGRQVNDVLTDTNKSGRKKYDIHPYGKTGSGVSNLVVYKDPATNEVYVLLGRKNAKPMDKSSGLADHFIIFGGYMKPHPLEGGMIEAENITDEQKDAAEEAILLNKDGYSSITSASKTRDNNASTSPKYDIDLEANALRKLEEETSLTWDPKTPPVLLGVQSKYAMTNDKRLHTIVADYLFDYGLRDTPPKAVPGSDIAEVVWVKISSITKNRTLPAQEIDSGSSRYSIVVDGKKTPIADRFGEVIEKYADTINVTLPDSN